MITKFLLAVHGRPANRTPRRPRHGRRLGVALTAGIVAALIGPAPSLADHAPEACTTNPTNGIGCVTVSDTPDPVSYSAVDGNDTFLRYRAVVTNRSAGGTLTHIGLTEALPAGTTCVSATTTRGTASCSGQSATATIGKLAKGQSATVDVEVTAPATADPNAPETTITNDGTLSFASNNPNEPGKDVSATYSETTTVSRDAGDTYCPAGEDCQVDSAPHPLQNAYASIPSPPVDLLATLGVLPEDGFCLVGQATIQGTVHVCRGGGPFDINVVEAASGATYTNNANPMTFHMRWASQLISLLQDEGNFVVFHRTTLNGPVSVIGDTADERCPAEGGTGTALPRICNITEGPDGSWSVDAITGSNGYWR